MDIFIEKSPDFLQLRFCIGTQLWQQAGSFPVCHPCQPTRAKVQKGPFLRVIFTGTTHLYLQSREILSVMETLLLSSLSCQVEEVAKAFGMKDD